MIIFLIHNLSLGKLSLCSLMPSPHVTVRVSQMKTTWARRKTVVVDKPYVPNRKHIIDIGVRWSPLPTPPQRQIIDSYSLTHERCDKVQSTNICDGLSSWTLHEIALRWMSQNTGDGTLVLVMAWCRQAASHYLSQCWHRTVSTYSVTRPQWVNTSLNSKCVMIMKVVNFIAVWQERVSITTSVLTHLP